jgi:BirA family biotin operon repressor/biotin-[acetyl-CoA-carboxylase] ligase
MAVFTDSITYADSAFGMPVGHWRVPDSVVPAEVRLLLEAIYGRRTIRESKLEPSSRWSYVFLTESAALSHYDLLIDLSRREVDLPDRILCLAGSGEQFHGFKGRAWSAPSGNIYMAVYLAPGRPVEHAGTSFTVLAAVSVLDAIDGVPGLRDAATVKWVNDILIGEAKVAGVLAYTQSEGDVVTDVVLGIGLNVETTPSVEPTPFVPRVGAIKGMAPEPELCSLPLVFERLTDAVSSNYEKVLSGGYIPLVDRYRERSVVIGREVTLCSEHSGSRGDIQATGRVKSLGDDLELVLDGYERPFTNGRLILEANR